MSEHRIDVDDPDADEVFARTPRRRNAGRVTGDVLIPLGRRLEQTARWLTEPWRSPGLAIALVASFVAPSLMLASADLFRQSAADTITQQLLDERVDELGVTVEASGTVSAVSVAALDDALGTQIAGIPLLGETRRTISAPDVELASSSETDGGAVVASTGTVFQRAGAVEALDRLDGDISTAGIWISERVAERTGLETGQEVTVGGSRPVPIAGIYANLWEGHRADYWDAVPPTLVPRYSTVFGGPLLELFVVPESVVHELGVRGVVRWDAPLGILPTSYDALEGLAVLYRNVERSYTQSPEVAAAIADFSGPGGQTPTLRTGLFDRRDEADGIVSDLEQPVRTAAFAGVVIGLLIASAGAAFIVRKRESEFRLLRSDGDPAWRFAIRAVAQYGAFAVVGTALGVVCAFGLVAGFGPTAPVDGDAIEAKWVIAAMTAGLLATAFVTAMAAVRILERPTARTAGLRIAWLLPIVGLAVAGWIQAGSTADRADVDLLVVIFPLTGLAATVGVITVAARVLMRRAHRTGGGLPTAFFLAWRRITAADAGAALLAAAMGVALGLLVFSSVLVGSLEKASDAKTITVVGGETNVRLVDRDDVALPPETTIIQRQTSLLTIGNRSVNVLVLDPETFADGVSWDPLFGSTPLELLDLLETRVDADLAAVAVGRLALTAEGGFGTTTVVSYEVVGELSSAPLASPANPTLVVRADRFEEAARRLHDLARPPDTSTDVWDTEFRSPTRNYVRIIVSQLEPDELTAFLDANQVRFRDVETASGERDLLANRAAEWTFEFFRLLAIVAALVGVGTLLFYVSERRSTAKLSTAMMSRMGLSARAGRTAVVLEMVGLLVFALIAGTGSGLLIAARTFGRFEPDPRIPPEVGLQYSLLPIVGIAAGAIVIVVTAALWSHRSTGRLSYGDVLRGP